MNAKKDYESCFKTYKRLLESEMIIHIVNMDNLESFLEFRTFSSVLKTTFPSKRMLKKDYESCFKTYKRLLESEMIIHIVNMDNLESFLEFRTFSSVLKTTFPSK
ncbi:unnamed protein product [Phyllotreta striolata]|uniref:Uncharacterized protein n=1 Tax=Phyllotreta striolata TaxID=444603 RepID=A0A9P0GXY3_PHYSR|nr:unnamed protein product [Phyllotreta striolata]